jgi:uracil-DNA glycosylase
MFDIDELSRLYVDIRDCHICPRMDKSKASRLIQAVDLESDVFIISEALARCQLRRSGVNFFDEYGKLGNAGEQLEKFLNKFQRTVYPYLEVATCLNIRIPKRQPGFLSVYNTEITQCYPGPRRPKGDEICRCISKGFLIKEIELIKPKLLLLMGRVSRDSFFQYVLETKHPQSLSEHIDSIVQDGKIPRFSLGCLSLYVLPIQHASGRNWRRFRSMIEDDSLIDLIRGVLK